MNFILSFILTDFFQAIEDTYYFVKDWKFCHLHKLHFRGLAHERSWTASLKNAIASLVKVILLTHIAQKLWRLFV